MEGGSANHYDYCSGDPVNCNDLDGLKKKRALPDLRGKCLAGNYADLTSFECERYRLAVVEGDSDYYYNPRKSVNQSHGDVLSRFKCPASLKTFAQAAGVGGFARAVAGDHPVRNAVGTYAVGEGERIAGNFSGAAAKISPWVTAGATVIDAACTAKDHYTR